MKRMMYIPLALLITTPSLALAKVQGEVNLGLRGTHFASDDESAKFDEYRDMSDGLFGSANLFYDSEEYTFGLDIENPALDDQSYEITGRRFGKYKFSLYYDELNHQLSRNALTPAIGVGSNYLIIPDADNAASVPDVSEWRRFDYNIERDVLGGEFTLNTELPIYFHVAMEQQSHEGVMPWGLINTSDFELPMPVDYTTRNLTAEGGYRSKETTVVLAAGYSKFENDNDLLTTNDGVETYEYSTPADNYSYNFNGRLKQRLPMNSLLALKASYNRHISEADFSQYTTITSPSADGEYDGDVRYLRANAVLTTQWDDALDTRLFYNFVDRSNDSEEITSIDGGERTNHLYEYDKNQAGVDLNYRLNKTNKIEGGYEFTSTDRNREDADSSQDNLLFAQLKNSSLDWMSVKLRLEYLNRSTDSNFSPETLEGDGLIHQYYTAFDIASKDRVKGKLAFDFSLTEDLDLALSYALMYDDYDATVYGVQDDQRHEVYLDANLKMKSNIKFTTYAGYEYTNSNFEARRYFGASPAPDTPVDSNNYNWSQETDYDFAVIGASLTVPVLTNLDMVLKANHQLVDGNIDFARSAAAGDPLEPVTEADDYYKTEAELKAIYRVSDAWSVTMGYLYEKSNLEEWKYENYTYTPGSDYLSGAGLDSDYEAHQFYMIGTYRF